jgi:hypothetical protein
VCLRYTTFPQNFFCNDGFFASSIAAIHARQSAGGNDVEKIKGLAKDFTNSQISAVEAI